MTRLYAQVCFQIKANFHIAYKSLKQNYIPQSFYNTSGKMRFWSILSLLCLSSLLVSQGEGSVTVATVAAVVTTGSTLIGLYRSYNMNGCWPRNIDDSHKLVLNSWYMTRASADAAIRDTLKKNPAKTLCEKVTGTTRYKVKCGTGNYEGVDCGRGRHEIIWHPSYYKLSQLTSDMATMNNQFVNGRMDDDSAEEDQ